MKNLLNDIFALDGGILIGLALGEKEFNSLKDHLIKEEVIGLTHELALTELLYIICRKATLNIALEKLRYLKLSRFIEIIPTSELIEEASQIKCRRSIALPDCFTLALAKIYNGTAIFTKLEKEIKREIEREAFKVDIVFLLDRKMAKKGEKNIIDI